MPQLTQDVVELVLAQGQRHSQYQQYMLMRQNRPIHRGCAVRRIGNDGQILPIAGDRTYIRANRLGPAAWDVCTVDATADHLLISTALGESELVGQSNVVTLINRSTGAVAWSHAVSSSDSRMPVPAAFNKANGHVLAIGQDGTPTLYEYTVDGSLVAATALGTGTYDRIESSSANYCRLGGSVDYLDPARMDVASALRAPENADMASSFEVGGYGIYSVSGIFSTNRTYVQNPRCIVESIDHDEDTHLVSIELSLPAGHTVQPGDEVNVNWFRLFTNQFESLSVSAVTATTVTGTWITIAPGLLPVTGQVAWLSRFILPATIVPAHTRYNDAGELFYYRSVVADGVRSHRIGKAIVPENVLWETEFHSSPATGTYLRMLKMCGTGDAAYLLVQSEPTDAWWQGYRLMYVTPSGLQWQRALQADSTSRSSILIDPLDGESLLVCGNVWPVDQYEMTGVDY